MLSVVKYKHLCDNAISLGKEYCIDMGGGGCMIGEKIRELRERNKLTQNDLARLLNITRSSVNAWESGLSVPSTQYVVELARIWKVSTDYLLGLNDTATISVTGLDTIEVGLLVETANKFRENREKEM